MFGLHHTRRVVNDIWRTTASGHRAFACERGVRRAERDVGVDGGDRARAYAELAGIRDKSGIKQVDRLLSNHP